MESGEWVVWVFVAISVFVIGGFGMRGSFMGPVLMILSLLVLVWVIYELVRSGRDEREEPLEALKRRYANGDISKDHYERMRDDIGK